jgi:hypothetical protein
MHKIPPGTSKNAQNPMRNFQKGTNSQEKLPNMHKIRRGSSKNAQDLMIASWDFVYFGKFLNGFCAYLEVPRVILCIFRSSS